MNCEDGVHVRIFITRKKETIKSLKRPLKITRSCRLACKISSKCLQIIAALFASPIVVICLHASQSLDEPLYPGPEAEHFQGVVEPAHCDAEIRLVTDYSVA